MVGQYVFLENTYSITLPEFTHYKVTAEKQDKLSHKKKKKINHFIGNDKMILNVSMRQK